MFSEIFSFNINRAFKLMRKIKCFSLFLGHVIHGIGKECIVRITRKEQNYLNYFACNNKMKYHAYNPQ